MNPINSYMQDWAAAQLTCCRICPRDCRVNRTRGEKGRCGAGCYAEYFSEFVHYGEEAELVPSHTVYLTGCNMACAFCHTADERSTSRGTRLTPSPLEAIIERGRRQGARNVNFLGGEPMVNLPALLLLFGDMTNLPPLVWNTNMYATEEAVSMLSGIPAVYLVDLKFGHSGCAEDVAQTRGYVPTVRDRLKRLYSGPERAKILLRHLILPGHMECCTRPTLEWIATEVPEVRVSLNTDYLVMPRCGGQGHLGRFLTCREIDAAYELADSLKLRLVPRAGSARDGCSEFESDAVAGNRDTPTEFAKDVEIVISPEGNVFLRHPIREAIEVLAALSPMQAILNEEAGRAR